jgi:16S rRNA (cytidine1402-2'-O)-methyltransferase
MHPSPARPGTLYVVATPIGNLRDISLRALDILKSVDLVAAEDTRTTAFLLAAHGIEARLFAYHEHNEKSAAPVLVERLLGGASVALVSDAGTPGISDPGTVLVAAAWAAGIPVEPIPGANAALAALSACGLDAPHWLFYGFLPAKAGARRKVLEGLRALPQALVFYEAPHRIEECIADLAGVLGVARQACLGRELTKRFETLHRCTLGEAGSWLAADENRRRGEFVLVVAGAEPEAADELAAARPVLAALLEELPASQAARLAARLTGARKNRLYEEALRLSATDADN